LYTETSGADFVARSALGAADVRKAGRRGKRCCDYAGAYLGRSQYPRSMMREDKAGP